MINFAIYTSLLNHEALSLHTHIDLPNTVCQHNFMHLFSNLNSYSFSSHDHLNLFFCIFIDYFELVFLRTTDDWYHDEYFQITCIDNAEWQHLRIT